MRAAALETPCSLAPPPGSFGSFTWPPSKGFTRAMQASKLPFISRPDPPIKKAAKNSLEPPRAQIGQHGTTPVDTGCATPT